MKTKNKSIKLKVYRGLFFFKVIQVTCIYPLDKKGRSKNYRTVQDWQIITLDFMKTNKE